MPSNPDSIPGPRVNPARAPRMRPDNTPDINDRIEIGPTPLAYDEWEKAGLQCPDLPAMRQYRLDRIVGNLKARDLDGVLLFDPLSIRYATDTTHMQLWNAHNPFRACLVTTDGYMVLWEYGGYAYMSAYNPLVREVRAGASFFYFATGQRTEEKAGLFAGQIVDVGCVQWIKSADLGSCLRQRNRIEAEKIYTVGADLDERQLEKSVCKAVLENRKIKSDSVANSAREEKRDMAPVPKADDVGRRSLGRS